MSKRAAVLGVGASQGLGAALARRFAREGYQTFIAGRNADRLAAIADMLAGQGVAVPTDVTDAGQVENFFAEMDKHGSPDIVIYNAGGNQAVPFLEIEPELFERFWRVCCYGGFLVGQAAVRRMQPKGRGTILFTGASASLRGRRNFAAFSSGKSALRMVAQSMAREFGPQGIHVGHVIIDGGINGDRINQRMPHLASERGEYGLLELEPIAEQFWQLHNQHPSAWTHETELRPFREPF